MSDAVSDGSSFNCPFCTSKLKLQVPSSPLTGDGKNVGNSSNALFPPPGGQCTVCPSAPVPCTPSVSNIDPGQSPISTDGLSALGSGCSYMCAKGGLITLDKSTQSSAKHDEAEDGSLLKTIVGLIADFAPGISSLKSAGEVFTGKDLVTGEDVGRGAAVLGIVPGGKILSKGPKALKVGRTLAKASRKTKPAKKIAKKSISQKAIDGQKSHLTRKDLHSARKEASGEVVKVRDDGKPFNHIQEVNDAQQGLKKTIVKLKKGLNENYSPLEKARIEKEISEASKLLDLSEEFLPSKPFIPPGSSAPIPPPL